MAKALKEIKSVSAAEPVGNIPFHPAPKADADGGDGDAAVSAAELVFSDEAQMRAKFPLLAARMDAWMQGENPAPVTTIRVTAKEDNFRRGGVLHSGKNDYAPEYFTPIQLEQLLGEPLLIVEFLASAD